MPAEAVAVASFSLNQPGIQTEQSPLPASEPDRAGHRAGNFANIEQVTIFALPTEAGAPNLTMNTLPGCLGLAITSRNPEQTKQVLSTLLATANPAASQQNGRYKVGMSGGQDIYCHLDQINKTTLLSLNCSVINASATALKNRKSVVAAGRSLQRRGRRPHAGCEQTVSRQRWRRDAALEPAVETKGVAESQLKDWNTSFEQLASATAATTLELRTDEPLNGFAANVGLAGIPPLNQILGPVTQLNRLNDQARSESATRKLKANSRHHHAGDRAPAIDGSKDAVWNTAREYKLGNVLETPATSAADLSASYRALWDEKQSVCAGRSERRNARS